MHDYKNVYMNIYSPICEYLCVDNIIFALFSMQYVLSSTLWYVLFCTICALLYNMCSPVRYVLSCTICALDYMCSTVRYVLLSIICALQ